MMVLESGLLVGSKLLSSKEQNRPDVFLALLSWRMSTEKLQTIILGMGWSIQSCLFRSSTTVKACQPDGARALVAKLDRGEDVLVILAKPLLVLMVQTLRLEVQVCFAMRLLCSPDSTFSSESRKSNYSPVTSFIFGCSVLFVGEREGDGGEVKTALHGVLSNTVSMFGGEATAQTVAECRTVIYVRIQSNIISYTRLIVIY